MRKILLALLFTLAATPALADNGAQASLGCAPWDGTTLDLKVFPPDITYKITVWGSGYEALGKGAMTIDIDNAKETDAAGTGHAEMCGPRGQCNARNISVSFEKIELKPGGTVKGMIENKIPFETTIAPTRMPCG